MGMLFKKQKVFISHDGIDGNVSAEAVLLKQFLDKIDFLDNYMDVDTSISDELPPELSDAIRQSNSFLFLIPFDGDVSYLNNPANRVYKEISDAIFKYNIMPVKSGRKTFQILPVTFSNSFEWPDALPQEISNISQFDICKLNLNDKAGVIQNKLKRALHNKAHRSINRLGTAILAIIVVLAAYLGVRYIKKLQEDRINEDRIADMKSSFQDKYASRLQPAYYIPINERTPLEDSIYYFFELRDQFYHIVRTLPVIKNTGIERNDDFTANTIRRVEHEYSSVLIFIVDLTNLTNSLYVIFDDEQDALSNLQTRCRIILDELLKKINSGFSKGNVRKSFKVAIQITETYEFWEIINQITMLLEETARHCNMILDHQ